MDSQPIVVADRDDNRETPIDSSSDDTNNSQCDSIEEDSQEETKVVKNVVASSKYKVPKRHAKKKERTETFTSRPLLPKGTSYVVKLIPKHPLKFGASYRSDFANDIKLSIGDEGLERFRQTIFGPYLNIPHCNFQGQIIKCLLLLEVDQSNTDELHIRHAKGNVLRFTVREFGIITGLKCTGNADEYRYSDSIRSKLLEKYFPGSRHGVNKGRLVQRFKIGQWDNIEEAVQMAIIYFLHTFIFSQIDQSPIPLQHFHLVEDGSYVHYPWGQVVFQKLIKSFRQAVTKSKKLYRLSGMPYALNAWIYECASKVPHDVAVKDGKNIPRILNWQATGLRPKYNFLMSTIFSKIICSNVVPTPEELQAYDLPGPSNLPFNEASSSGIQIPPSDQHRNMDGNDKACDGYVSENDDPPRPRNVFIQSNDERMVDLL